MKLTLKAHGAKRLKLKYDELLSKFALNFNLPRYILSVESYIHNRGLPAGADTRSLRSQLEQRQDTFMS